MCTVSCAWEIRRIRGVWRTRWVMIEGARAKRSLKKEERGEYSGHRTVHAKRWKWENQTK